MQTEEYTKIVEKVNFEESWLLDLDYKNELNTTNIKIAMSAIRHILWQLMEDK